MPQTTSHPRRKLIEVALPLEAINEASAREKSIRHGHPSTLHLWWARRPLAACRAVIFTSLVDDPDDPAAPPAFVQACRALPRGRNAAAGDTPRMRLFDFIETLVQWESTTDEKVIGQARELIRLCAGDTPPPLLDPFAGGGSIPLEAQRLGLEAHASDLNPVAVMINKALIEIPPRFAGRPPMNPDYRTQSAEHRQLADRTWRGAQGLAADVRYYGQWMREQARQRIGHLYPTHNGETVIAWLWARTVQCPNPACRCQMPLVRSFELSKKTGRRAWVTPSPSPSPSEGEGRSEGRRVTFTVRTGDAGKPPDGTVNRRGATCVCCGAPVPFEHIRAEGRAGRMGAQLMAIVTEGRNGRNYHAPAPEHEEIARMAVPQDAPDTDLPEQALGFRVQAYGMTKHRDLFTARQLVALTTFSDLVAEAREQAQRDALAAGLLDDDAPLRDGGAGARAYAEAVSVYLAFAVDKAADYWTTICFWHNGAAHQKIVNTFSRQAIPMAWDYAEGNPFSDSSGNFCRFVTLISEVLDNSISATTTCKATQVDARSLKNDLAAIISTDPPYYDNIGYADLSDFFYVWLRRGLRAIFPEVFSTVLVPKELELIAAPHRLNGDKVAANQFFEKGLSKAFAQMRKSALADYPLSVFYAFKQTDNEDDGDDDETAIASTGWETMLTGLIESGFVINGTWPMRTELLTALKKTVNALASSIVLVCRPRPADAPAASRRQFLDALRRELPAALKELQSGNIAPVDLAQAVIGPGMAIYSRYRKVLEADGAPLTVRVALGLINQELDAYLAEQDSTIDNETRFAVAWFQQYGFGAGEFGVADVLARAKNTSVEGLVNAGVAKARRGKVQLVHWNEYDPAARDWAPGGDRRATVWEATHHLIERLNLRGETGAGQLLAQMNPDMAAEARALAYRLYSVCERKGWAEHARDYNALVAQWAGIQEQALAKPGAASQAGLL